MAPSKPRSSACRSRSASLAAFARFVAPRLATHPAERLDGPALYLVCACLAGDRRALAAFDQRYLATLAPGLTRLERTGVASEDVVQLLRIRFLLGEAGRPPRIGEYTGASDLRAWLRVAAVRIAISLQRKHRREDPADDEALAALADAAPGPELELMKEIYRAGFTTAFRDAVAALAPRERNLLRHQAIDRLGLSARGSTIGGRLRISEFELGYWRSYAAHSSSTGFRPEYGLYVEEAKISTTLESIYAQHFHSSPDGKWIAYIKTTSKTEMWVMAHDGSHARILFTARES
mgnify:CR=1 FL=1